MEANRQQQFTENDEHLSKVLQSARPCNEFEVPLNGVGSIPSVDSAYRSEPIEVAACRGWDRYGVFSILFLVFWGVGGAYWTLDHFFVIMEGEPFVVFDSSMAAYSLLGIINAIAWVFWGGIVVFKVEQCNLSKYWLFALIWPIWLMPLSLFSTYLYFADVF